DGPGPGAQATAGRSRPLPPIGRGSPPPHRARLHLGTHGFDHEGADAGRDRDGRLKDDGEGVQAAKAEVVAPGDGAGPQLEVGKTLEHFPKGGLSLDAPQRRTEAEMAGPAEGDVTVVGPGEVQAVRVRK